MSEMPTEQTAGTGSSPTNNANEENEALREKLGEVTLGSQQVNLKPPPFRKSSNIHNFNIEIPIIAQ